MIALGDFMKALTLADHDSELRLTLKSGFTVSVSAPPLGRSLGRPLRPGAS
jgi:hypothetical protein